jgi:hypothetical protein
MREQVVKMIAKEYKRSYEEAAELKEKGGVNITHMKNFAFSNGKSFSMR